MESTSPGGGGGGPELGTLLILEPKSLREFTTNTEYLFAMKEDLAEWFSALYQKEITAQNFLNVLETGVILCQHANEVQTFAKQRRERGVSLEMRSYFVSSIPEGQVQVRENVKPGTFQARDNVSNFITWCIQLGIPDVLRFETDDLVLRKNEKSVILCLLEMARVGAKLGMSAPTIVQMEEEIDAELATGEPPPQIKTCNMKSLDEVVRELVGRCTCPIQFPMFKVGEGKYQIGDSKTLIFVRILRNHVMVRVGGGWDTLEHYLDKHDPCRCNFTGHRHSSSSQRVIRRPPIANANNVRPTTPTGRAATPTAGTSSNNPGLSSPRKMSSAVASHGSSSPAMRSKSPGPVSRRLPTPQPRSQTPQQECANTSHWRSRSPAPSSIRSQSPGLQPKRILPRPADVDGSRMSHRAASPSPKKRTLTPARSLGSGLDKTGSHDSRKFSLTMEANGRGVDVDEVDPGTASHINMEKISTMTLDEFKNLLNNSLSVPSSNTGGNCAASLSSESPRSQSSSDSCKLQSHRRSSVCDSRDKTKLSVCKSFQTNLNSHRKHSLDDSGYLSQNCNRSRNDVPDSPDSFQSKPQSVVLRSRTPTSTSRTNIISRPRAPVTNPRSKTPTNSQRPQTPTEGQDESRNYSTDTSSQSSERPERPSTPSMIPRFSVPRPTTPSTTSTSSNPITSVSNPQQSERPPTPSRRQIAIQRPTTPVKVSTYTSIYIARKSSTPGPEPVTPRSVIPGTVHRRSVTPGPREAWKGSSQTNNSDKVVGERGRSLSRSVDFSSQVRKAKSVTDVRTSLSLTAREISISDDEDEHVNKENKNQSGNEMKRVNLQNRTSSCDTKRYLPRQTAFDQTTSFVISRNTSGSHCVTLKENGETKYDSTQSNNPDVNANTERSRPRSKTPDPSMMRQRPRSVEPRGLIQRKENNGRPALVISRTNSGQHVHSRTEAWVNSTVENKRKLPRPKRSMTPNSLDVSELKLEPRPLEEIKAALQLPINGFTVDPVALEAPPEDPKAFMEMEKLFKKYKEMELRASLNETPGGGALHSDGVVKASPGILKKNSSLDTRSPSSRSLNSVSFSTPSLSSATTSSTSSKAPSDVANGNGYSADCKNTPEEQTQPARLSKSFSVPNSPSTDTSNIVTSTPLKEKGVASSVEEVPMNDVEHDSAMALVSKIKEILKVRPRKDQSEGPRTRIPAPKLTKDRKSKSFSSLCSLSSPSNENVSFTMDGQDVCDDSAELSQFERSDSYQDSDRCQTPVPRMATPLTTGRSTFINTPNNNNKPDSGKKLVRAFSNDPNLSNSLSSITSSLSISTTENEPEFV
ncbi:flocculation protein FLO11-like [Gigantopelta aegis]|uniref:flocculation protein FLO11-like n=1 Tax=Gigantopelta aegis TaxID=1735272 RepID=UPI001B88B11B|nr:flocculation protein FLO11-like [Gigantopelta aegis]